MSRLGGTVIGAVGACLLFQVAASAAPRAASENWIGTWGYVALPPPAAIDNPGNVPVDTTTTDLGNVGEGGTDGAVVNAGIGGNRLPRYGLGPSALSRLDRDVLSVPGLKVIILLEGINDIGVGLGTLTPYQGAGYASPAGEMVREALNHWIRSSGVFDKAMGDSIDLSLILK